MFYMPAGTNTERKSGKDSAKLLISAIATVGALLLIALMCFWGCFLYKKLGKNDGKGLAMDVSGGILLSHILIGEGSFICFIRY